MDSKPVVRRFSEPDEVVDVPGLVHSEILEIGGFGLARTVHAAGFRWSTHVAPLVGTEWCEVRHIGLLVSGIMHVQLATGEEFEVGPGEVFDIPAHHDGWIVGGEECVTIDWTGVRSWLSPLDSLSRRVLLTVLFTDLVDSTGTATSLGPTRWGELLAQHGNIVGDTLARFRGRLVSTTGDGVLATFDGAARAIRCAPALHEALGSLGLRIRIGIHTGEVDLASEDISGVTVHEAARILALAGPGETLISDVTAGLVSDADIALVEFGTHELRGTGKSRVLYKVG
ncbi:MAG: adenylate/guanylate cyclase domain-containing protein [Acidimicrobiia bacterium]